MWRREGSLRKEEGLVGPQEGQAKDGASKVKGGSGGEEVLRKVKGVEDAKRKFSVSCYVHLSAPEPISVWS